jgi:hypothetical protein
MSEESSRFDEPWTLARYLIHNYAAAFGGCEGYLQNFFVMREKVDRTSSDGMRGRLAQSAKSSLDRALAIDPDAARIAAGGWAAFETHMTGPFLERNRDRIFLNHCERCGTLTRTPRARLCLSCGHSWHDREPGPPQPESTPPGTSTRSGA